MCAKRKTCLGTAARPISGIAERLHLSLALAFVACARRALTLNPCAPGGQDTFRDYGAPFGSGDEIGVFVDLASSPGAVPCCTCVHSCIFRLWNRKFSAAHGLGSAYKLPAAAAACLCDWFQLFVSVSTKVLRAACLSNHVARLGILQLLWLSTLNLTWRMAGGCP